MTPTDSRTARLVAVLKDDPRVSGVARLRNVAGLPAYEHVLVITTWDGFESLPTELPERLQSAFGDTAVRTGSALPGGCSALGADGVRLDVELRRAGDLKPTKDGAAAEPLHDPYGIVEQWVRCCVAEHGEEPAGCGVADRAGSLLRADIDLRLHESGRVLSLPEDARAARRIRDTLRADDPVEAALAARIDAWTRTLPRPGAGERIVGGPGREEYLERFLAIADGEGFRGDRVLFGEAVKRLRELAKREPVFEEGFVVPTFDAVEAAFSLGEAVGGCQPPVVPGVWVGVGVTPKDALEFWAAPCVRIPHAPVALVDDLGERDVVLRSAGREPMVAALTSAIDTAWDRLPALVDAVRDATKESVDPAAVLATLHLPRSFVDRARSRGAGGLMCSRLAVALSLVRAAEGCAPLTARKLGLAAGRALAAR